MKKILSAALALSMLAWAAPASADMNSSNVSFYASNSGAIINVTSATADTGGNTAGGSEGGKGGSGGDVESDGDYNNGGAGAGDGGNGGDASAGGLVNTGDAEADAGSINKLNTNEVKVGGGDDCGCDDINSSYIGGKIRNEGVIVDVTLADAQTGDNKARGSRGGKGGSGGDLEGGSGDHNNGGAGAGDGGNGGDGGLGGEVNTGDATSNAGSINVMNTNIVRVRS